MLTYLHVKNFKSLLDFTIDFRNNRNTPRKLNIIYGENGAGKSNIVDVFDFIKRILFSRILVPNLDIDESQDIPKIVNFIKQQNLINNIIKDYKTIEYDENMHVECGIKLGKTCYEYIIETDSERIIYEKLSIIKKQKTDNLFEISLKNYNIQATTNNTNYMKELSTEIDKYWGKHAFISIVLYEIHDKMLKYVTKNINKNIIKIIDIFIGYNLSKQMNKYGINRINSNISLFVNNIGSGTIKLDKQYLLNTTEKILNSIITSLYSDIKQIYYDITIEQDEIEYKLYCKKMIGNKLINIPFIRESTGTQKLFELIPLFVSSLDGNIVIIDEFDTGIHDLMVKALLENFAKHIKGQLILTTHSTTLMEANIKKDNIYILDILSNRNKEVYSLTDYDMKLHPNLNIRKRYLSGIYGGVPYINDINFNEIDEIIKNAEKNQK